MRRLPFFLALPLLMAFPVAADPVGEKVYEDARVVRRVATLGGRDLPREILKKIVQDDIETLRGRQDDGTYRYARYEREEGGKVSDGFSVRRGDGEKSSSARFRGEWIFRIDASVPSRRMVVAKNRRLFLDRIEADYILPGQARTSQVFTVERWLEPGERHSVELPGIARDLVATVYARVEDSERGASTLDVTLVQATLVDLPQSPYYEAVQNAKALLKTVERQDASDIRKAADALAHSLPAASQVAARSRFDVPPPVDAIPEVPRVREPIGLQPTPAIEIYLELQRIEDLLTGSESERRDGMDRLHQLIRRLRPPR